MMESLARNGYTEEQVRDMLHMKYGSRVVKFRYDILDRFERKKGELSRVISGEVSMSAFATIKRTAKFTLEEENFEKMRYYTWQDLDNKTWSEEGGNEFRTMWALDKELSPMVDWLNDRIQPFVMFQMPDGGFVEFSLGIFLLSSPVRKDQNGQVVREVEAYDGLIILDQDKFTDRHYIKAGTTYESAVRQILQSAGITKINIDIPSGERLPNDKEYATGDTKLTAINDLLTAINNTPLWVDSSGYYRSSRYERPEDKPVGYVYSDQELSIIREEAEEEFDLFDVANSWVITVSNPESEPMTSRKDNNNPDSPTSIPSRGRRIVDFREVEDIASQAALDSYTERIASEASQVYGRAKFKTPIMPFHEYYDAIVFQYEPLGINDKFMETDWTIPLEAGAMMEHEVRKVVSIN
ncbi:hypothetical protein [Bacillus phage PK1]